MENKYCGSKDSKLRYVKEQISSLHDKKFYFESIPGRYTLNYM